jgi:peroxiredoxin
MLVRPMSIATLVLMCGSFAGANPPSTAFEPAPRHALAPGTIEGRVVDAEHHPAAGVRVILGELGRALLFYNTPAEMFASTPGIAAPENKRFALELATDKDGTFHATDLAPGDFSLIAADAKLGIAIGETRVESGVAAKIELALLRPGLLAADISGLAFDPQKNTLELAPASQGTNVRLSPRLTQRAGQWSFESAPLPAIRGWRIVGAEVVMAQDYRATLFSLPVSIDAGSEQHVARVLDHGNEITGTVVDSGGKPLSGVSVVARDHATSPVELGAVTDLKGRYRIRGLGKGPHTLELARWKMREAIGCGNGVQDLSVSREVEVPVESGRDPPRDVDFKIEALLGAPSAGDPAPQFQARSIDGASVDLAALRGKVVLIDFWATWCGMCRTEMPSMIETYDRLAKDGRFQIVGVSVDTDVALVPRFVASRGMRWPQIALGGAAENPIARLYNVNSTPTTVLVDRAGRIVALDLTGEPLRTKIEELLRVP